MGRKKKEDIVEEPKYPRIILGLDVSTSCIGISIIEDDGTDNVPKIIAITHKSPKLPSKIKGIESLFIKKQLFEEGFLKKINEYTNKKITDVVIEEPLLSSNNTWTVTTLLRYNGLIADAVYRTIGIVPSFISSYDARTYSFPELISIRKYNKRGEEYPLAHIKTAIRRNNVTLFGSYPFDVDKKSVMMNMVNNLYTGESAIPWSYDNNGELKKENYDACDSLICALAYININHHGLSKPTITDCQIDNIDGKLTVNYTMSLWDRKYEKKLILENEKQLI